MQAYQREYLDNLTQIAALAAWKLPEGLSFGAYAAQLREEVKASDHYAMWRKHSGFAPIGYINSMLEEQDQDPRQVVVELN